MPKKNRSYKERLFKRQTIKESFGDDVKYIVAELPICAEGLIKKNSKRCKKYLVGAETALRQCGAEAILYTAECKRLFPFIKAEGRVLVPPRLMCECILFVKNKALGGGRASDSLLLCDRELSAVSYRELARLCRVFKNIGVATDKTEAAEKIASMLLENYGICISVLSYDEIGAAGYRCVVADVDCGCVYFGDFAVNGIEALTDTGEYNVDSLDVTAAMLETGAADFEIKCYISGKNRLTIND